MGVSVAGLRALSPSDPRYNVQANALEEEGGKFPGKVAARGSLDELQRVWLNDFSFNPRPFAERVHQPVLALFGGLDKSTPIESAANPANVMLHNEKLTIEFFPHRESRISGSQDRRATAKAQR